jgi:NADH-quinone oxidoreductase subunit G
MEGSNMSANTVTIFIDEVPYEVSTEDNLLAGVLSQKLNLPYFCWHPSMGSVGACRQCAVTQFQDENDQRGRLVMACTTPVTDGMRISIKNAQASEFREQVIAAMMTNHPHDCPVCAEGGECHLQDMTVMTGHSAREYQGSKRTFTNQYLGELVGHEMNRCITCYRCTRFYNDYAGGKDFGVYGSKNQVYFGRQTDGALESEFSGNLVEVCPTGVFTNKVFSAHYTRKWDLQSAPSVCSHCSVGCNLSIGERYGSVRRVMNRYNSELNGYFLCDRGRFGIGYVNSEQRLRQVKGIAQQSPVQLSKLDVAKALSYFRLKNFIGIGSARASLEANFYLKSIVGSCNFSAGYNDSEMQVAAQHAQLMQLGKVPNLAKIETSDFVLIVGEDITQTAPRMALAVRQALRNAAIEKASSIGIPSWQDSAVRTIGGKLLSPLFSLHSTTTKLDDVAEQALLMPVERMSICLQALEKLLGVSNNKNVEKHISEHFRQESYLQEQLSKNEQHFIVAVYQGLYRAKKPMIISGTSLVNAELLESIDNLMLSFKQENDIIVPDLIITPPCSNSVGLLSLLDEHSLSLEQVLTKLSKQKSNEKAQPIQGLIILEQELAKCSESQVKQLRALAETLIVLDHSEHRLTKLADIVLPVATVSEGDGHYINYQGRAQKFSQVHPPVLPIQESWRWLDSVANILGVKVIGDDILKTVFDENSDLSVSIDASNNSSSKVNTISKNTHCESLTQLHQFFAQHYSYWPELMVDITHQEDEKSIARMSHRASGRTSKMANISVHESKTTQRTDDNFSFSMEGAPIKKASEMPFAWAPGWNSNQAIGQYQEYISGPLLQQAKARFITIPTALMCNSQWQLLNNNESDTENSNHDYLAQAAANLTYVQQQNIYLGEWQAAMTPEFQMRKQSNQVFINNEIAERMNVKHQQWCKVVFSATNEKMQLASQTVISQVMVLSGLPTSLVYGNFPLCQSLTHQLEMKVTPAGAQEITDYLSRYHDDILAAEASKKSLLERLKKNDQTIPIRLVSGGLNDA